MRQLVDVTTTDHTLSVLVQKIESGDEIVSTREGRPVARIVHEADDVHLPSELTPEQQATARLAMERIRARAARLKLGPFDIEEFKRDRDEGRRCVSFWTLRSPSLG